MELQSPRRAPLLVSTDEDEPSLRDASASAKRQGFFRVLKENLPTVLSIVSVLFNVLILAALIPALKSDISSIQGQASSLQSTVNSFSSSLLILSDQINGAGTKIDTFYSQLNATTIAFDVTQARITTFFESTDALLSNATAAISTLSEETQHASVQLSNQTTLALRQLHQANDTYYTGLDRLYSHYLPEALLLSNLTGRLVDVQQQVASFHRVVPYKPVLFGSVANGSIAYTNQTGVYSVVGSTVLYSYFLAVQISGSPAGALSVSIPVPASPHLSGAVIVGSGLISSIATDMPPSLGRDTTLCLQFYDWTNGGVLPIQPTTAPSTLYLVGSIAYPTGETTATSHTTPLAHPLTDAISR